MSNQMLIRSIFATVGTMATLASIDAIAENRIPSPWKPIVDAVVTGMERRLNTFTDLMKALEAGQSVRGVFQYKKCELLSLKDFVDGTVTNPEEQTNDPKCKLTVANKPLSCFGSDKNGMDATGGLRFDTWEKFGPDITKNWPDKRLFVAASDTKLISIRGFVLNYGNVKVFEDNEVLLRVNYLDPKDYTIKMDEGFRCQISNGRDDLGAAFFTGR